MSLLIKALEQAAKDRDSARAADNAAEPTLEPPPPPRPVPSLDAVAREPQAATEPPAFARGTPQLDPAAPPPARGTPSLEPAASPRPRPSLDASEPRAPPARPPAAPASPLARGPASPASTAAPRATPTATPPRPATTSKSFAAESAARRTQQTTVSLENIDAQEQRARAATVMQASGGAAGNALSYLRGNPVAAVGALAVLCGLGYGIYVYLQISHPGLFVRQAAKEPDKTAAATLPPSPVPPPASAAPVAGAPTDTTAGRTPLPGVPGPAAALAPAALPEPATAPAATAAPSPSGAISASAVIGAPRASDGPRVPAPAEQRVAEMPRERGSIAPIAPIIGDVPKTSLPPARPTASPPSPAPAAASRASAAETLTPGRERVSITAAAPQPRINPALSEAYAALQTGTLDVARSQYSRVLQSEPQNVDAMLGLAYISAQENRTDDAMRFYTRILQINPRHPQAQAALIGLVGRADPIASETRLKQLISREPSAFLHFILGNVYADQSLWAQAQAAYFQAHHLEPANPDYAYNLAIGLDHIGQSKSALNFYRLAEQLASSSGRANFSVTHARERIGALSSKLD